MIPADDRVDVALVGGGLASAIVARAMRMERPELRVALVERDVRLGGEHTWCFHDGDVPSMAAEKTRAWTLPLIERSWNGYDVRFPDGHERALAGGYHAVTSARLAAALQDDARSSAGAFRLWLGREARDVRADGITLADGHVVGARLVLDARGLGEAPAARAGFQKFVGHEVELAEPASLSRPLLMDATVAQDDGFRFFYVLPFSATRLLIEDTAFSSDAALGEPAFDERIMAYARGRGWRIKRVLRRERGVLPMPWTRAPRVDDGVARIGLAGGWFHPATGYSFPMALRVADAVTRAFKGDARGVFAALASLRDEHAANMQFARGLNWLLFNRIAPARRWRIFDRFYRLPADVIARFYALQSTRLDRARILVGQALPGRWENQRAGTGVPARPEPWTTPSPPQTEAS